MYGVTRVLALISHLVDWNSVFPVYRLGGLLWAKLIHNQATPFVVTWPIRQHHFTSESFICIILLLLDRVKVARSNFTTGYVI